MRVRNKQSRVADHHEIPSTQIEAERIVAVVRSEFLRNLETNIIRRDKLPIATGNLVFGRWRLDEIHFIKSYYR
jgi:hypothetical protein